MLQQVNAECQESSDMDLLHALLQPQRHHKTLLLEVAMKDHLVPRKNFTRPRMQVARQIP